MNKQFWIIETPRSTIHPSLHWQIIFALNKPKEYIAGPFLREGDAILNVKRGLPLEPKA